MKINICGIPHEVIESNDNFEGNTCGIIDYMGCTITLNKRLTPEAKRETLFHEIVHGIFHHIGRNDLASDETLVQTLGNAIYQTFELKNTEKKGK